MILFAGSCKNMEGDFRLVTDFIRNAILALAKQVVKTISARKHALLGAVIRMSHEIGDSDRVSKTSL